MEKTKKYVIVLSVLVLAVILLFTVRTVWQGEKLVDEPKTEDVTKEIESSGDIVGDKIGVTLSLFQSSFKENENTLISPLSVEAAMAMAANGAAGDTLLEMEGLFGKTEKQNQYFQAFFSDEQLKSANSLWIKEETGSGNIDLKDDFVDKISSCYKAEIFEKAFDESTLDEINQWISEKTDGYVQQGMDAIDEYAVLYLMNTIVFEAEWEEKFNKQITEKSIFYASDDKQYEMDFMYSMEHTFIGDDKSSGVIKAYEGGRFSFAAILPNEEIKLKDYVVQLKREEFLNLIQKQSRVNLEIELPKWKQESRIKLKDVLKEMGIKDLFDEQKADLSHITQTYPLFVNDIVHKTFMEIDEDGTKAGAATIVGIDRLTAKMPEKHIKFDRPFLFCILDNETNLPIFMGAFVSPE